jgi:hypothetical protein
MPIRNPRWLPPQVIVLTQDHMGKYRNIFLSEAIALVEPKITHDILHMRSAHLPLHHSCSLKPEAFKSLYRSPDYKKNQLVLCKNYALQCLMGLYNFFFFMLIGNPS